MKKMKNNGFTLMELMIVIAIVAIMASIAIPNFIGWLPERRLDAGLQDVLQGLQKSRSRAIMLNRRVVVNFDAAAESFTAFVDEDASGGQDAGELTLVDSDMPAGVDLTTNLVDAAAVAVAAVTFDNRGFPTASGTISLQNNNGTVGNVQLYLSGHSVLQ